MTRPAASDPTLDTNLATPDETFLGQFPIRDRLSLKAREQFDDDALFWREQLPIFETLKRDVAPLVERTEADLAREGLTLGKGSYFETTKEFLRQPSPNACTVCEACQGAATNPEGGDCPVCSGQGYDLPWFEDWGLD